MKASFKADCEAVARIILPIGNPAGLTEYCQYWVNLLASSWSIATLQPSRTEMKKRLIRILKAVSALNEALNEPVTYAFLERQHGPKFNKIVSDLSDPLKTIRDYATESVKSSALSDSTGKTKSGRGHTAVPGAIDSKVFCALVVAEAWKFVHGEYPSPKSQPAAQAALAFWSVSGGAQPKGWGKKREGAWPPYFEKARDAAHASRRAECLRILHAVKSRVDSLGI